MPDAWGGLINPPFSYRGLMGQTTKQRFFQAMVSFVSLAVLVGAVAAGEPPPTTGDQPSLAFLKRHWQVPIPPQGKPPARFSALEASLDPDRKSTRLNSSHSRASRMPSSA